MFLKKIYYYLGGHYKKQLDPLKTTGRISRLPFLIQLTAAGGMSHKLTESIFPKLSSGSDYLGVVFVLLALILSAFIFTLFVRRFHDFGWSGYWAAPIAVLIFVDIINFSGFALNLYPKDYIYQAFATQMDELDSLLSGLIFSTLFLGLILYTLLATIVCYFKKSTPVPNKYGSPLVFGAES